MLLISMGENEICFTHFCEWDTIVLNFGWMASIVFLPHSVPMLTNQQLSFSRTYTAQTTLIKFLFPGHSLILAWEHFLKSIHLRKCN